MGLTLSSVSFSRGQEAMFLLGLKQQTTCGGEDPVLVGGGGGGSALQLQGTRFHWQSVILENDYRPQMR